MPTLHYDGLDLMTLLRNGGCISRVSKRCSGRLIQQPLTPEWFGCSVGDCHYMKIGHFSDTFGPPNVLDVTSTACDGELSEQYLNGSVLVALQTLFDSEQTEEAKRIEERPGFHVGRFFLVSSSPIGLTVISGELMGTTHTAPDVVSAPRGSCFEPTLMVGQMRGDVTMTPSWKLKDRHLVANYRFELGAPIDSGALYPDGFIEGVMVEACAQPTPMDRPMAAPAG